MEFGVLSLGDLLPPPDGGPGSTEHERHRSLIDQAVAAEAAGFDVIHLGEHHGSDYHLSSPPVVLAAIGERTERLRLSTGVALAANLDPVRMAEDYATVDVLTNGRAEIVCGRGSFFARTFDFFGQDVQQSGALFDEHVRLLVRLLTEEKVDHGDGGLRPRLDGFTSRPRPVAHLPVWIGGGSSKATIDLAAELGCPLMLPSVFAPPGAFAPMVERYRERYEAAGHDAAPRVGACCHTHVAATTAEAVARFEPAYRQYWEWVQELISSFTPGIQEMPFDYESLLAGPAMVGSAEQIVDTIGQWNELLGLDRLITMFDLGGQPMPTVLDALERFGADVIPNVD